MLGLVRRMDVEELPFFRRVWEHITGFFSKIRTYTRLTKLVIKKKKRGEPVIFNFSELLPKDIYRD